MRILFAILALVGMPPAHAASLSRSTRQEFLALGGPRKALTHLQCILTHLQPYQFPLKEVGSDRCDQVENGPMVSFHNQNYALLVDYTAQSSVRQMYLLPLGNNPAPIQRFFVSHGRYRATSRVNTALSPDENTLLDAVYFSNEEGSNASATGFFITGQTYFGEYHGDDPNHPIPSMVVHGVEQAVNDNACGRATVVHGNEWVLERGPSAGMGLMSDGCWMVDYAIIELLLGKVAGSVTQGGAAMFVYGPREAVLSSDYYCR